MLLLISDAFDDTLPQKIAAFGEVTEDKSRLNEATIVLVRSKTKCDRAYIDSAKNLKLIIRGGVGIDNIDKKYAESKGIMVRNTPKVSSVTVAELTLSLMLAVPSRIIEGHNSMVKGEWTKKQLKRTELFGKTLCLIGIGNVAKEVAKRASAFGMKIVSYDKYVKKSDLAEMKESLGEAVREADYISIHLPLTSETKGIFNKKIIDTCIKNPILINTGRAGCINADDVAQALEDGRLKAYASDVWPSDPPLPEYPILKSKNTLMTPHIGGASVENLIRIGEEAYMAIKEFVEIFNI